MPHIHLEVQTNGDVTFCCHTNTQVVIGSLHESSLVELWKSKKVEEFRNLNSKLRSIHCESCSHYENNKMKSWREIHNESWDTAKPLYAESFEESNLLRSLGIRFSNTCNFSCRTCKPSTSTSWFSDAKFLNPNSVLKKISSTPKNKPLSSEIKPILNQLHHIYISGGEPLLEEDHFNLLTDIIELNPNLSLSYNTNLSTLFYKNRSILEKWSQIKKLFLNISIDGYGKQGEYIRKGLNWDTFVENFKQVSSSLPEAKISLAFTLSIYNSLHVLDFLDFVKVELFENNYKDKIEITLVEDPSPMSLLNIPSNAKKIITNKYLEYISNESCPTIIRCLKDAIQFMNSQNLDKVTEFTQFNQKLDFIRNELFKNTSKAEFDLYFSQKNGAHDEI